MLLQSHQTYDTRAQLQHHELGTLVIVALMVFWQNLGFSSLDRPSVQVAWSGCCYLTECSVTLSLGRQLLRLVRQGPPAGPVTLAVALAVTCRSLACTAKMPSCKACPRCSVKAQQVALGVICRSKYLAH
jgi:hypothetical protein